MMDSLRAKVVLGMGLLWATAGTAQVEPGQFRLGASLAALSIGTISVEKKSVDTQEFGLAPGGILRLGYTLTESWEAGLTAGVAHVEVDFGRREETATSWRIVPYVEYNKPLNLSKTLLLAPGLALGYADFSTGEIDFAGLELSGSLWLKYFLMERASLEFGIVLTYFTGDVSEDLRLFEGRGDLDATGVRVGPQVAFSIWPRRGGPKTGMASE